ncbi:MAG: radical SAM protein [Clostridia bacterium]|nr:radical SAM protein [Clostridia bacterium]
MIKKHYKNVKTIKKNTQLMDYYFMGKYHFSPYMACEHGCIYCDGRAEKYYVEGDFEKDIVIRRNLPDLLAQKLPSYREKGTFLIGSGISDPYQPIEAEEGLMRACLSHLSETDFSVSIMTKSTLALRDLDLLDTINQRSRCLLMVSLVFPTDEYRQIFEPRASTVEARLEMIKQFKARGIPVCVLAMPLLPGISDDMASVNLLFDKLKALKVDVVMPGGLTLRPGKQKDYFLDTIESHFPELLSTYQKIYKGNYPSGSPENWYVGKTMPAIYEALTQREIPTFVPHYVYKNAYPKYDELFILLKHMKKLYQYRDVSIEPLKRADSAYRKWYTTHKAVFNRKRSMTQEALEQELWYALNDPLSSVLSGNPKLTNFMKNAVFDAGIFNYTTLKLE